MYIDRARTYVKELLRTTERKMDGQLAEIHGDTTPDGIPYWLRRARWSPDALRVALLDTVVRVAGTRGCVKSRCEANKDAVGLDV